MGRNEQQSHTGRRWVFSSFSNPHHEKLINRFMKRPAEELYHTAEDYFEMTNLATDPAHAEIKNKLSIILDQQLREQGDPGRILDTKKAHKAAANLKPDFESKP